ncbi:MAG: winged helix-turn-helix transcriptional regulator [Deltaproteobacteria bacterium]|nr:winged helix-turn-helix transcriptional regulator [Deltaproteobacteria bacterium]MBW2397026.1 winged helix-turn-helix transcriptional regulator [Deltaproteobacteria bacterium]
MVEQLDRTFAALADPTRRAILGRLRRGPATVGQIAAPFEISLNGVSKHVRVLEEAGLVERKVEGREHHLRLRADPLRKVARYAAGYADFWEGRLDALEQHLRTKRKARR